MAIDNGFPIPAPTPNMARPSETTSRVATALAVTNGWRRPMLKTWVLNRIWLVRPARKHR